MSEAMDCINLLTKFIFYDYMIECNKLYKGTVSIILLILNEIWIVPVIPLLVNYPWIVLINYCQYMSNKLSFILSAFCYMYFNF